MKFTLSLRNKILVLCSTFIVPIGFLLYLTVSSYQKDIQFSSQELSGLIYLKPLIQLIDVTSERKLLLENGKAASSTEIQNMDDLLKKAVTELEEAQASVGESLQFTPEGLKQRSRESYTVANIKSKLNELNSSAHHQKLIDDLRVMISHAGDTSNLVLDPDLDTYYLMDIVLFALPQNKDRLQQIQSYVEALHSEGNFDSATRAQLGVYSAMLKESDLDRVAAGAQTALNEDPNFYGQSDELQAQFGPLVQKYKDAILPVVEFLQRGSQSGQFEISKADLSSKMNEARKVGISLWQFSAEQLYKMTDVRVSSYKGKQSTALYVSAASLLALVLLGYVGAGKLANSIATITTKLMQESKAVADVSLKLDLAAKELSNSTSEHGAAIEETVASMEQMTSMLSQTAQNANSGLSIAESGRSEAERGKETVARMNRAMDAIKSSNEKLESLVNIFSEIQSKTKVINDIVFETRLLSFNASIEAARAGAHGKGFAVVAEEVGKLANMSGKAAEEIRGLLENSSREVGEIVKTTQERVASGIEVSKECAETFMAMGTSLERIEQAVSSIASATREQEAGVQQTNAAMGEMDRVTQVNSSSAETLSTQAGRLETNARALDESIAQMHSFVFGGEGSIQHVATTQDDVKKVQPPLRLKSKSAHKKATAITIPVPKKSETSLEVPKRDDERWKNAG